MSKFIKVVNNIFELVLIGVPAIFTVYLIYRMFLDWPLQGFVFTLPGTSFIVGCVWDWLTKREDAGRFASAGTLAAIFLLWLIATIELAKIGYF